MSDGSTIVVTVQPQTIVVEASATTVTVEAAEVVVAGVRSINGETGVVEIDLPTPGDVDAKITGAAVTTDDSFDLPTPTGVGLEFVIVGDALDDIRMNGASL